MCYLVAKKFNEVGCVAYKTIQGERLADFKEQLLGKVGYDNIQLVTISRPSAYGEYEPYHFVENEKDFEEAVLEMR